MKIGDRYINFYSGQEVMILYIGKKSVFLEEEDGSECSDDIADFIMCHRLVPETKKYVVRVYKDENGKIKTSQAIEDDTFGIFTHPMNYTLIREFRFEVEENE